MAKAAWRERLARLKRSSRPDARSFPRALDRADPIELLDSTQTHQEEILMTHAMDPVIHFELPASDPLRVGRFYEEAFGWQTTPLGPDMGNFVLAFTVETDPETRLPQKSGAINGGFYERTEPDQTTKLTILVEDIRAAMDRIVAAGGRVLGEPVEMQGVGLFVSFVDPDGNVATINEDFAVMRLPETAAESRA
jgi:predicted enzyme related to lactoylglutathione lyase